jgi:hypothetical protein
VSVPRGVSENGGSWSTVLSPRSARTCSGRDVLYWCICAKFQHLVKIRATTSAAANTISTSAARKRKPQIIKENPPGHYWRAKLNPNSMRATHLLKHSSRVTPSVSANQPCTECSHPFAAPIQTWSAGIIQCAIAP